MKRSLLTVSLLGTLLGCQSATSAPATPDAGTDASGFADAPALADTGAPSEMGAPPSGAYASPPRRWADEARVTHDVDRDLTRVLERERLRGSCQRWSAGERDEETKLLCGKWMFFYETFGTVGIPTPLLTFAQTRYADYYGVGFENFGFVADPASPDGMPLGLAMTTGTLGNVETRAFTCAACHFGKMSDGRYAVGYGNLQLDYGRFIAGLGAPLMMSLNENDPSIHESIRNELLPHVQANKQDPAYQLEAASVGLELLNAGMGGALTLEDQERFLALAPGTMDFLTEPLVDDGVWTVSRILSLWNIPSAELRQAAGMPHESLSWTGGATTLQSFISGFVAIGVADPAEWTADRIEPLDAYLRSLRAPALERTLVAEAVERGAATFTSAGCAECHDGPSGESSRVYPYAEIGTDAELARIFNPDDGGTPCCGFASDNGEYIVTRGVKAPRLVGLENQVRWLHNGAVPSLASLLCLAERPADTQLAQGAGGHEFGCELDETERYDLIEYLLSL